MKNKDFQNIYKLDEISLFMKKSVFVGILFGLLLIGMIGFVVSENETSRVCARAGETSTSAPLGGDETIIPCCYGLIEIPDVSEDIYVNINGTYVIPENYVGFGYICTNCGNNICEAWEHKYNCPRDCNSNSTTFAPVCKNFYWFDKESRECGYKQFCGAYMYYGLETFSSRNDCEKKLEKTPECETYVDCPIAGCIGLNDCAPVYECIKGKCVSNDSSEKNFEKVTCNFLNSDRNEKCYLGKGEGLHEGISCSGVGSCVVDVNGKKGGEITWKSSCGGYQYTKQDGIDESIEFDCAGGKSNVSAIKKNDVRYAYWQCYDGKIGKAGDGESCYAAKRLQQKAEEDCKEHCKGEKCGVNSFSVGGNCYSEESINLDDSEEIPNSNITINDFKADLICKDSCAMDGKCYPFGYRTSGDYCTDKGSFDKQLGDNEKCDNNFECGSNVCVNSTCLSQGFIEKILEWFQNLFG